MTHQLVKPTLSPAEAYTTALGFVRDAMNVIDDLIQANPSDIEGLVRTGAILDQMGSDIKVIRSDVRHLTTKQLMTLPKAENGKRSAHVEGLGDVELAFTPRRKYDNDKVEAYLEVLGKRAAEGAERRGDDIVHAIVVAVRGALCKADPKIQQMRARGVDPDDMSTTEWGDPDYKVVNDTAPLIPAELLSGGGAQ